MAAGQSAPASYAARLSAMGGESRRSSFGAPAFSMKDVEEEDGLLDKALAFSKPSDVMLCNPFKVGYGPVAAYS